MFSRCYRISKKYIGKRFGIFPIPKREMYRKYIIKKDLLIIVIEENVL